MELCNKLVTCPNKKDFLIVLQGMELCNKLATCPAKKEFLIVLKGASNLRRERSNIWGTVLRVS
jgi:hypothetical protein